MNTVMEGHIRSNAKLYVLFACALQNPDTPGIYLPPNFPKQKSLLMKQLFTLFCLCISLGLFAQGTITGVVVDANEQEALIGASILVKGTTKGAIADVDGSFRITGVAPGDVTLEITYVGYAAEQIELTVADGENELGLISMRSDAVGLDEVEVIASVAIDRKTPVAVSTISGEQVEAMVGNQEYPEILRKTPSIYVTKEGGGFGDSRINVRGFNQRNVAVMINGIPVNDMENGWVYWSNWAGLADVTSRIQVQRGLGASKLAVASVGGSINIVTNAADLERGGTASVSIGNDAYQKYGLSYSTGLSNSGWAFSAQATHTQGDGYVEGTMFRAWSYFASLTKQFNDQHMVSITALGAPQWHHQRLMPGSFDNITLRTFHDPDNTGEAGMNLGTDWNWFWGELDGEEFNWRRNFYHKPKAFVNHYWTISPRTDLKTSVYASLGRGGGTGPRGRLRLDEPPFSIFDSYSGLGQGVHDQNGHVRFDDIVRYNQGQAIPGWGQKVINPVTGTYIVSEDGRIYYDAQGNIVSDDKVEYDTRDASGSGFIRRASMNSHNWYGILSTLSHELNDNFNLVAGIDGRYYKGIHYRRVENLLGADGYSAKSDINNMSNIITEEDPAEFGSFAASSYKDGNNVLNYYNDGIVNWFGAFVQVEYSNDQLSAFLSGSASNQGFKRIDYFNYLDSDPQQETDFENILGGNVKGGANYNIDENHNVFFNAGYYSKQPIFDNVYINFINNLNEEVQNQTITAFELGYGFRSRGFNAKLNLYSTNWGNRQFSITDENANDEELLYQFENVEQRHLGLELEMVYQPVRALELYGMLSVGDWKYASNFTARGQNIDTQQPEGELTIYADGLPVGDAAQTTFSIGANYEIVRGLRVYADYYMADRLFADYDVNDSQFTDPNEVPMIAEVPSYSLVDAGISYNFDLSEMLRMSLRFNMNNVFDETYVSELETNIPDDPNTSINELYDNRGIYGFGRTWNAGVKLYF